MTVGALLDLGADKAVLKTALDSLKLDGYHLHFGRTTKCGIDAYDFTVHLEKGQHNDFHRHDHTGTYDHDSHSHSHPHRNINDIYALIDGLDVSAGVKNKSKQMFDIVAEAESKAHGIPIEEVHFHEVGAIDSIIDIISVAVCIENLGIDQIVVSPLTEGFGTIECQHGVIPIPVPATTNIAISYDLEIRYSQNEGEMVTPTGAAIAAALQTNEELPERYRILKVGLGAGIKDFAQANILRAMIIEDTTVPLTGNIPQNKLWSLEANIDDTNGEAFGLLMDVLLEAGALDVWYTPVYMKKNRPAYKVNLLCQKSKIEEMTELLFTHSTTIGIRYYPVYRKVLTREIKRVETEFGAADVKVCYYNEQKFFYPEFESIKTLCTKNSQNYQTIYQKILEKAEEELGIGKT